MSCQYGNEPFSSKQDWVQHLSLQHDFQSNWRSVNCPLCIEPTGDGKMAIMKHLANHFEEISLSSLPTGVDSENESGDETSHVTTATSEKAFLGQSDGNGQQPSAFGPDCFQQNLNALPKIVWVPAKKANSKQEQSRSPSSLDCYPIASYDSDQLWPESPEIQGDQVDVYGPAATDNTTDKGSICAFCHVSYRTNAQLK